MEKRTLGNTDFESGNLCICSSSRPHLNTFKQFGKRSKEEQRAIHIGYQRTAVFLGCTLFYTIRRLFKGTLGSQ